MQRLRKRSSLLIFVGVIGVLVFSVVHNFTYPSFNIATHTPMNGFAKLNCPIFLGKNEIGHIDVSIKNPKGHPLNYDVSFTLDPYVPDKQIIGRKTVLIPGLGTQSVRFLYQASHTGVIDARIEAISSEDPKMVPSGGGVRYPEWQSSFGQGCLIRSVGTPLPFNLIIIIFIWASGFTFLVGVLSR